MRATITLDDELLATAKSMTGIEATPSLIRAGLKALIEREAARRLIVLGGSDPDAEAPPRRRWEAA